MKSFWKISFILSILLGVSIGMMPNIYAQSVTMGSPINITPDPDDDPVHPDIAISGTNVYITWQERKPTCDIFFIRSGTGLFDDSPISQALTDTNQQCDRFPIVGATGSTVFVAYHDGNFPTGNVFLASNTNNGQGGFNIIDLSPNTQSLSAEEPRMVVTDKAYVIWTNELDNLGVNEYDIWFATVSTGGTVSNKMNLSNRVSTSFFDYTNHVIAADGNTVAAAWLDDGSSTDNIVVRVSSDGGETFTSGFIVNEIEGPFDSDNEIFNIAVSGNNVYVVWQGGHDGNLYFRSTNNEGTSWNDEVQLSSSGDHTVPNIAAEGNYVYIFWDAQSGGAKYLVSDDSGETFGDILQLVTIDTFPGPFEILTSGNRIFVKNTGNNQPDWLHSSFDNAQTFERDAIPGNMGNDLLARLAVDENTVYIATSDVKAENSGVGEIQYVQASIIEQPCSPPLSGDWIVTTSCTLTTDATIIDGDLIVQNNALLTIASGVTLTIDFTTHNISIQFGSGVLIKTGGKII